MKRLCKTSQFALFALLVITILVFGVMNHDILSVASLYSLARTCTVPSIFALAIMVVMVIGELDMYYCMIGACFLCVTRKKYYKISSPGYIFGSGWNFYCAATSQLVFN